MECFNFDNAGLEELQIQDDIIKRPSNTKTDSKLKGDLLSSGIDWNKKYRQDTKLFLEEMNIRISHVKKANYKIISNIKSQLIIPKKNEQVRIRTQQQINLLSIVLGVLAKHKVAEEIMITTYSFNKEVFNIFVDLLKAGRIKKLFLFIASSYFFRDPGHAKHLKAKCLHLNAAGYDIHLSFAWLHMKITLIHAGSEYYQMEGSSNYSNNNMVEQIFFENNKKTYDHDRKFMTGIMMKKPKNRLSLFAK